MFMAEPNSFRRVSKTRRARLLHAHKSAPVEIQHAKVGSKYIRYAVKPGVGEPLLLCNGIGANLELTFPLLKALGKRPVVVVDLPGTGGSDSMHFWPSLGRYARFAVDTLEHAGFSGKFAVAGVSWGGGLAQRIARDYASRVTHMVLMATSPGLTMIPGKLSAISRMATPRRYLSRGFMAKNAPIIYGGEMRNSPQNAVDHARLVMPPSGLAYIQQLLAMYGFSSLPWLHRLSCPTLILSGDDDPLIRVANAHVLTTLIPNARLHVVRGGGHLFMTLRAEETAQWINDWVNDGIKDSQEDLL